MTQNDSEPRHVSPGSITQIRIAMKYTLLDFIRSRRFFVILIITLVIGIILTGVVGYYRPAGFVSSDLAFYSSWWGTFVSFVIILSGIFFGGDAISGEFQNKTGYFSAPNPIRRSSIYIGKWLAAFVASTVILGVFTVFTIGNGLYYFSSIPYQFGESFLFSIFYLVAVLGLTFFFSSLFKSSSMSILVTVILFLFVFNLVDSLMSIFVHIEPWFILTYGAVIISRVLTVPYPAHITTTATPIGDTGATFTTTTFVPTIPEGLAIIAIYFVITAVLGLILFERKEFN